MSLILDALNKAQREREEQREPVPQLSTVHYTPPPVSAESSRRFGRKSLLAGAALLCVAAFAGGLWFAGGGSDAVVPEAKPQSAPPVAVERPAPAPVASSESPSSASPELAVAPQPPAPVRGPAREEVAGLYKVTRAEYAGSRAIVNRAPATPVAPTGTAASTGAKASQAAGSQPSASAPEVRTAAMPAPASQQSAAPVAEPAKPAPVPEPADTLAARKDLPSLQELSWSMQQSLPSIMYAEHHYGSDAAAHRVVINGANHRAGSQLGQGLVLEEILRDGVVLRYQSQTFKLEALNSWVNF